MSGFTLVELLVSLLILSVLALMSYRGLGAVLDARQQVTEETEKWRRVASFFARFERDVQLAAPRAVRGANGPLPAWNGNDGRNAPVPGTFLEFSRFASAEGVDTARRLAYTMSDKQAIELWVWPGLDVAPDTAPARHAVLNGVVRMELQYLDAHLSWTDVWPGTENDPILPSAVRLSIVLSSGERLTRVFSLRS